MLEDLFSMVKVRFNGDKTDDDTKKTDIPKGLLFKCPTTIQGSAQGKDWI